MNKKIIIAGIAVLAMLAGCSGSDSNDIPTEVDNTLPNGVWAISDFTYTDKETGEVVFTRDGTALITDEGWFEYYDLDDGDECDLDFTQKSTTLWTEKHATFDSSGPMGGVGTASFTETGTDVMDVFVDTLSGSAAGVFTRTGDYTSTTEYELDQRTCGEAVFEAEGFWLETSNEDPNVARERVTTVVHVTDYDPVTNIVSLDLYYDTTEVEGSCSEIEYGIRVEMSEVTFDKDNLVTTGLDGRSSTHVRVTNPDQAQTLPAC